MMSPVLLKLSSGMELIGHDSSQHRRAGDPITLTSAFIVIAQRVEPDQIQFGLAPVSLAAADPNNITCTIDASQIIATPEVSDLLRDAHRSATGKVAVARAPVIQLAR